MVALLGPRRALLDSGYARSLLSGLQAVWTLEDAAGSPTDKSGNGNTLTNTNSVTLAAGPSAKIPNAAHFNAPSSQYYSIADNSFVSSNGNAAITWAVWAYLDAVPVSDQWILMRGTPTGNQWEFLLGYINASSRYGFQHSVDGASLSAMLTASSFGAPGATAWHFIVVDYNPVSGTVGISVNGGVRDTQAEGSGIFDSTGSLLIGARNDGPLEFLTGRAAYPMKWDRNLTAPEIAYLYNGGAGRSFVPSRGFV